MKRQFKIFILFFFFSIVRVFGDEEGYIAPDSSEKSVAAVFAQPLTLLVNSFYEEDKAGILYVTTVLKNTGALECLQKISIQCPIGWHSILGDTAEVSIAEDDTLLHIFGVKIPSNALAGEYRLVVDVGGDYVLRGELTVVVQPKVALTAKIKDLRENYIHGDPLDLTLTCQNDGNAPVRAFLEAKTDPICKIKYFAEPFEIPPYSSIDIPIYLDSEHNKYDTRQYIFVKIFEKETGEKLFHYPISLNLAIPGIYKNDEFIHIPAEFSMLAYGSNQKQIFASQISGAGIIDPERKRYLEFFFLLPTTNQNFYYNLQQILFIGLNEPDWNMKLGDSTYSLTTLTQQSRFGRGAGISIDQEAWSTGIHYSQNAFNSKIYPKEACGYVEFYPTEYSDISINYMHKDIKGCLTSNIVSIDSEVEYIADNHLELEVGKDFTTKSYHRGTYAYNVEAWGKCFKSLQYDIKNIYAGPAFNGNYQCMNLFSLSVSTPLSRQVMGSVNYSTVKQNVTWGWRQKGNHSRHKNILSSSDSDWYDEGALLAPRQDQFVGNISYNFLNKTSLTVNSRLLHARDLSINCNNDFKQGCAGFTYSGTRAGYSFNATISLGKQKDYLRNKTSFFLQTYNFYVSKSFVPNLHASLFYQTGNIDFYDPRLWYTAFGGTVGCRFYPGSYAEISINRSTNACKTSNATQLTCRANHLFKNFHSIQVRGQYFLSKNSSVNTYLFLASYTIPFGLNVGRRKDIGNVQGCVYNTYHQCVVPEAQVALHDGYAVTDATGRFTFSGIPKGEKQLRLPILPDNLLAVEASPYLVNVIGGGKTRTSIPVIPCCSIGGEVVLYAEENAFLFKELEPCEIIPQNGLGGINIVISRDNGKEVYSVLSSTDGKFYFPKLRPGEWLVSVNTEALPPHHYLNMNKFSFEMRPEEMKMLRIEVRPEAKQILKFDE